METPLTPLENSEKIFSPETPDLSSAKKNEAISQIYEEPQIEEVAETDVASEITENKSTSPSSKIVEKTTGKIFEGREVGKEASNLTKTADSLETEALEGITEIHNLPNAKP